MLFSLIVAISLSSRPVVVAAEIILGGDVVEEGVAVVVTLVSKLSLSVEFSHSREWRRYIASSWSCLLVWVAYMASAL